MGVNDLLLGLAQNWKVLFVFWMQAKKEKALLIRVNLRKSASNALSV